jgi:hypothetical protein
MPDVPLLPEKEDGATETMVRRVEEGTRAAVTGDPYGRLRRPVLFLIVGVALVLDAPAVGLVALLLLALTDAVVKL